MNALELADTLEEDVKWLVALNTSLPERLIQASTMLRQQDKYIQRLHKLCNVNGLGVGRNLLTGEMIPFEVRDEL